MEEEAEFEKPEEEETTSASVPAEEPTENSKATVATWQKHGHGQYVKVKKSIASKDEELNEEAEGLINALTAPTPVYPSSKKSTYNNC